MVGLRGTKYRVFGPAAQCSPVPKLYGSHPAAIGELRRKKCLILAQSQKSPANLRRTTSNSVMRHVLVAAASKRVLEEVDYRAIYLGTDFDTVTETFLWERLSGILSYLPDKHLRRIREGLRFAYAAHDGQRRKSGEPFITHPVEVARLLGEIRMDADTVIAGLLHDTVEDTDDVTFDSIEDKFGSSVRNIVEGETKLSKIAKLTSSLEQDCKARDLMQLFLSMTKEVRVIIVKLTDRLHNMRTLDSMKPEKQKKIAEETMNVFVPLARLLGLYCVKEELEDLSFKYLEPAKYEVVSKALLRVAEKQEAVLLRAQEDLLTQLKGDKVLAAVADGFEVRLRTKSSYAAYKENLALKKPLKDVQSAVNLQVIVTPSKNFMTCGVDELSRQVCYLVLCTVHGIWRPIPGTLVDHVAHPKINGYQSIHTRVVPISVLKDPTCQLVPVDVQIRTRDMDLLAHFGILSRNFGAGTSFNHVCMDGMSLAVYKQNSTDADGMDRNEMAHGGSSTPPAATLLTTPALNGHGHKHGGRALKKAIMLSADELPLHNGNGRGSHRLVKPVAEPSSSLQHFLPIEELCKSTTALAALLCLRRSGMLDAAVRVYRDTPAAGAATTNWWSTLSIDWLTSIRKWTELSGVSATEFVDGVTNDVLNSKVVVFTPEGERKNLPQGSTCVDFAYLLHSELGDSMRAARVNSLFVRPEYTLSSGDIVEIVKDPAPPTPASLRRHAKWAGIVQTRKARLHIRQFLKSHAELLGGDIDLDFMPEGSSARAVCETVAVVRRCIPAAVPLPAKSQPVSHAVDTEDDDEEPVEEQQGLLPAVAVARPVSEAVCANMAAVLRGVPRATPLSGAAVISHALDVGCELEQEGEEEEQVLVQRPVAAVVCATVAAVRRAVPAPPAVVAAAPASAPVAERPVAAAVRAVVAAVRRAVPAPLAVGAAAPAAAPVPEPRMPAAFSAVVAVLGRAVPVPRPAVAARLTVAEVPTVAEAPTVAVAAAPQRLVAAVPAPPSTEDSVAPLLMVLPVPAFAGSAATVQRNTVADDLAVVGFAIMTGLTYMLQVLPVSDMIEQMQLAL